MKLLIGIPLGLTWSCCVIAGFASMERYESTSGIGVAAKAPSRAECGKWHFQLFVASGCPCSRASMSALKAAVESHVDSTTCEVVFVDNPQEDSWLLQKAKSIRNCTVRTKVSDVKHAHTSGQAFLFSPSGALVYAGGLTQGRGVDDSRYAMNLFERARTQTLEQKEGPVYGCALNGGAK